MLSIFPPLAAQPVVSNNWDETGLLDIQNYGPAEYRAAPVNHDVIIDDRNIVYFANNAGILEFDGSDWRLLKLPDKESVHALCFFQGRIYVGATNNLGYLTPTAAGQWRFVSLKSFIPDTLQNFKNIWEIVATDDAVFFRSYYAVFKWSKGKMTTFVPKTLFHNAYSCGNDFYVREINSGLKKLQQDSLLFIADGELFSKQAIAAILPFTKDKTLIISRYDGWFLFDGQSIKRFSTSADKYLKNNFVFKAVRLPDDKIAVATQRNGFALFDLQGNLLKIINKNSGLRDNTVTSLVFDNQWGVWAGLNNGLAHLKTEPVFSYFAESNGLEGLTNCITRYNNTIYVGTNMGLYWLDSGRNPEPSFKKVNEILTMVWCFWENDNHLYAGTHSGLYRIENDRAFRISDNVIGVTALLASPENANHFYAGLYNGLGIFDLQDGEKALFRHIEGITDQVMDLITDDYNKILWIGARDGVYSLNTSELPDEKIIHYGPRHNIAQGRTYMEKTDNGIVFAGRKGLKAFDMEQKRFFADTSFGEIFADTNCTFRTIRTDESGNIWLVAYKEEQALIGVLKNNNQGRYEWQDVPFQYLENLVDINMIMPEKDGTVWFCGSEKLIRYFPPMQSAGSKSTPVLFRAVKNPRADSMFFGGVTTADQPALDIDYKYNSLRFRFALPWYDNSQGNRFQVRMSGFDDDWLPWSRENYRDYTALAPGNYVFHVRAKNIYGHMMEEKELPFSIIAPWYLSAWSYLLYLSIFILLLVAGIKWRLRQMQIKTEILEKIVAERTKTIQQQADQLKEMHSIKSRFFANISHEFRTPLTLILGPLQGLIDQSKKSEQKNTLKLIRQNARRLLRLINQLLDLSRLESGQMKLQISKGDFVSYLKGIVMSFASLADQRKINLRFESNLPDFNPPAYYFDRDKIEKIFVNLLSNAFKFTMQGGEVIIKIYIERPSHSPLVNGESISSGTDKGLGAVSISIANTGPGIPAENVPYVFDRFYQVDSDGNRHQQGTGIGLALVKELTEIHKGRIELQSSVEEGTVFTVTLPLFKSAYLEDELVEVNVDTAPRNEDLLPASITRGGSPSLSGGFKKGSPIILVVEDHDDVRQYICEHLKDNFNIIEVNNAKDGYKQALSRLPDLIISDVMMPDIDGYEFCREIKQNNKTSHIPVILLTARADEQSKLTGLEGGSDDYLIKPFNPKELRIRVNNLIEQRRRLRKQFSLHERFKPGESNLPSVEVAFIRNLRLVIEKNLHNEKFDVEQLSRLLNMSRRQLLRKIKAISGQTPTELIKSMRLSKAYELIKKNTASISEIAFQVGFNNLSYFTKSFRKQFSVLPSDIQKNIEV